MNFRIICIVIILISLFSSNVLAHTGGLIELAVFGIIFLFVPVCIGVSSGIPKLIFIINFLKDQEKINIKRIVFGIAIEILVLTAIFYMSIKIPKNFLIKIIDITANTSTYISIILLKMYVISELNTAFVFFTIIILPIYYLIAKIIMRHFYRIELKIFGSIFVNLFMPVVLCALIVVFSSVNQLNKKNPRGFNSKNVNINNTLLIHSSSLGLPTLSGRLLEKGADVNFDSGNGFTPLFASFSSGIGSLEDRYETCKLLLNHGAHVNARDARGCPAVVLLARRQQIALAKLLIEHGADISAKDQFGKTYNDYYLQYKLK